MEDMFPGLDELCSVKALKLLCFEGNCRDVADHVRGKTDSLKVEYSGEEVEKP